MRVRFTCSIGYSMARQEEVMEFEDNVTDDEIEEAYQAWIQNFLDGGWTRL